MNKYDVRAVQYLAKYCKDINLDFVKKHLSKIDRSFYNENILLSEDMLSQINSIYDNYQDLV
jgi:hypothetical protein